MTQPSPWLRGPVEGVQPELMPVAHALIDAREGIARAVGELSDADLCARPGGAASIEFHLRHIAGSVDRLLTYSRGEQLTDDQRRWLEVEKDSGMPRTALINAVDGAIDAALAALRGTVKSSLHEPRLIGAAQLPSSVFGLLHHVAEHTQRHVGQIVTTAKILQGSKT